MAGEFFVKSIYRKVKDIIINKFTFGDKLLIISILFISIISYGVYSVFSTNSKEKIVTVKQEEKILLQLSIGNEKKGGVYYFNFDKGVGAIEVKDSKVRMLPMDKSICPEEICSKTGWTDGGFKCIVCLPNRLIVRITDNESETVDGVAS